MCDWPTVRLSALADISRTMRAEVRRTKGELTISVVFINKDFFVPSCLPFIFSNWRRGWDSNPRNGFPLTAFPVLPIQPLLHLSEEQKNRGQRSEVRDQKSGVPVSS